MSDFARDGYTIVRQAIPLGMLNEFEQAIVDRAGYEGPSSDWVTGLREIEAQDKEAFCRVMTEPGASAAGLAVAATLSRAVASVLEETTSRLYPFTAVVFWNDEHVKRLQYDWHQERSYYPDRFSVHAWFPLFRDIGAEDGPMIVCSGSHAEHLSFATERESDGLTQHRIEGQELAEFPQVACTLPRGDALIFHENLAHSTGHNTSGLPRVSGVVRYFLPLNDPDSFRPILAHLV